MGQPAVLLFGTANHPVLTVLYHYLRERGRRRVVYLVNELFPQQPRFFHQLSRDGQNGRFLLEDGSQLDWEDIVAVGLDGYFIHPPGLEEFTERDREYLQTEAWAALIAIFEALARRTRVANHVLNREVFNSRLALLAYLARHEVPIPRLCVTSDPDAAREFTATYPTVFRPIAGLDMPFSEWTEHSQNRLARLSLCPVHFEARLEGPPGRIMRVGDRWLAGGEAPPEELIEALHNATDDLGLQLAEAHWRQTASGWVCMDLKAFVSPGIFADRETADMLASYFEGDEL